MCIGMIFWSHPISLPTVTTEISALDLVSALEFKLEKADSLINEIEFLKEDIKFMKKPGYLFFRACF